MDLPDYTTPEAEPENRRITMTSTRNGNLELFYFQIMLSPPPGDAPRYPTRDR